MPSLDFLAITFSLFNDWISFDFNILQQQIRKVQQPHFCKFVKKIDLIGKDVDDAPSVASSRSRRSHDRKASSTRDSTDTPIRVWLGDDDDDGSTTVVGRIVKASSAVSLSSIVDAGGFNEYAKYLTIELAFHIFQ